MATAKKASPAGQAAYGDASFQSGDVLRGRYEIERLLGSRLDKAVYLARDRTLGCPVALDVIPDDALMPSGLTVTAWEAQVLGQLGDHRNIGTVLDRWEDAGTAFMVSRYLSGGSLRDLIERRPESGEPLPVGDILRLATEISRGLAHIHGRGMLHRDLQPRNVLLDEWGTVRIVDFDLAVLLDDPEMSDISNREVIAYMAPEATKGVQLDERADLYSLGATIYEMCSGSPPHSGSWEEILTSRYTAHPRRSRGRIFPTVCADSFTPCLPPTASSGHYGRKTWSTTWRIFTRLRGISNSFCPAMSRTYWNSSRPSECRSGNRSLS